MAISQPQQYCLRWNNHQHNLLSVFEDLLNHEAFVDVTLACEGLNLKAHKMVLSACSPYFHSMFYNTPDKHPVVFLKDVRYEEMKALLEFMYRGEVSVDQENLSSLLKVAEGLKIKGLADVNESHGGIPGPRLSLPLPNPAPHLPMYHGSLMSPEQSLKRLQASSSPHGFLGPKRKRGRPRRLSGAESIPLAVNLSEESMGEETSSPLHHIPSPHHHPSPLSHPSPLQHTTPHHQPPKEDSSHPSHPSSNLPDTMENEQSPVKSLKEGTGAMSLSPGDLKVSDFPSEAESNDGRSSGVSLSFLPPLHRDPDLIHILDPVSINRAATAKSKLGGTHEEQTIPNQSIKLEPGVTQPLPSYANPLKLEIQDSYVDSEGALIIADENSSCLDYTVNEDGSCLCKLCGELTQSRTHWYRHKYKVHNIQCLYRCDKCEVFFKSKKGFEGHLANRHAPKNLSADLRGKSRKEVEGLNKVLKELQARKEAEMVQKIIEKVKAECRAQGEDVDRRGYTKHH